MLKKYLFILVSVIPALGFGQSFADRISDCYRYLMDNEDLTVTIQTIARDAQQYDRIVDNETFVYTHDQSGFYMNMMGMEILQGSDLALKIDHELKEVAILPLPESKEGQQAALPSWLMGLDQLDASFAVSMEKTKQGEHYLIKKDHEKIMEVKLRQNRVHSVVQYPQQKVVYNDEKIMAILEMEYSYQKAQRHLQISEVINSANNKITLRKKFIEYQLVDYRKYKQ